MKEAYRTQFVGALFDFDGTITEPGSPAPAPEMAQALIDLARKMPIGFCTGRELGSFERHGLSALVEILPEAEYEALLSNIFLLAENGAMGYHYDLSKARYEPFYQVPWPEEFIAREEVKRILREVVGDLGDLYDSHTTTLVVRTQYAGSNDVERIYECCRQIHEKLTTFFIQYNVEYERHLHIGNSGIGVIIGPAEGDKDQAIMRFAQYLKAERQMLIGEQAREILVVGDQPFPCGNDHYFLRGEFGTPFTVGEYDPTEPFPHPVCNEKGTRLFHSAGTRYLLDTFLLKRS